MAKSNIRQKNMNRKLKAASGAGDGARSVFARWVGVDIPGRYVLGAVLFVIASILPVAWGVHPLPYHLGYAAQRDIVSRVQFDWHDEVEEEDIVAEIEATYANRYLEEPKQDWMNRVFGRVWNLLQKAREVKKVEELLAYAKEKELSLSPEQADILLGEIGAGRRELYLSFDIVDPMRAVLEERIFSRGVLPSQRMKSEQGRQIQIVDEYGSIRMSRVSPYSGEGPVDISHVPAILTTRFAREMQRFSLEFRNLLRDLLVSRLLPTLVYDKEGSATELASLKKSIRSQTREVEAGELLLRYGQIIGPADLQKIRAEDRAYTFQQGWKLLAKRIGGKAALIFGMSLGFVFYLCSLLRPGKIRDHNAIGLGVLACAVISFAHFIIYWGISPVLLPIGLFAGIVALSMGVRVAMLAVTACGLSCLVLFEGQLPVMLSLLGSGWIFACLVPGVRQKLGLIRLSIASGFFGAILVIGWALAVGEDPFAGVHINGVKQFYSAQIPLTQGAWLVASWLASGVILIFSLPVLEAVFSATTNIRLQELQDQNHPCLRRLIIEAPGTYHHSIIVGTLAEAGAEAIGANGLLAKVGSMYHDIGKLMKPEYFSENEVGVSRHDSLKPAMSTMVIIGHVKDGMEMAEEFNLPGGIREIIGQHHGRGVVTFFHHRAMVQAGGGSVDVDEFRYPGPIPQSQEAAIVMIADSVEAASRSMERPSSAHIRKLVHGIVMDRLTDHQMEASGLTMTDLGKIEKAFARILTSMFHSRVKYPGGRDDEEDKRRRR